MSKAKKLPSGNWRVQLFIGYGEKQKKIYKSFTATTKAEAEYAAMQYKREECAVPTEYTIKQAMLKYIESRSNVLSPTTIQGYKKIANHNLQQIMDIKVLNITQQDIQTAVNADAQTLSAKTISNSHGLLAAVLKLYRPGMRLSTSLPRSKKPLKELPLPQKIFSAVRGSDIELPVLLAMWLSFSMSEIRGIKKSDIKDGVLTLNRSVVDVDNKPVIKESMKEYNRTRRHLVPPYIMELIDQCPNDFIITLNSYSIYYRWKRILAKNNLPPMPFHDLRHVSASVMHLLGIPDKYAMERGGWKTDATMKSVYQNIFTEERIEVDKKIDSYFESIINS